MAALSVEIALDDLRELVPKFVNATTLEISKEMRRQAALLVRDDNDNGLLKITPPYGITEGKDLGDWSVERDIRKVFAAKPTIMGALRKTRNANKWNQMIKRGDLQGAKDFLNERTSGVVQVRGYTTRRKGKTITVAPYTQKREVSSLGVNQLGHIASIAQVPSAMLHRSRRVRSGQEAGRVRRPMWSQVVLDKTPLNQYIKDRQKRVGTLKAGWAKAAKDAGLSVSTPRYILGNLSFASGSGRASDSNPNAMHVTLVNSSSFASSKISRDNINFIVGLRQQAIAKEMEYRLSALAKKAA